MLKRFHRSERGFALVLTLIFLPVFIGVGLLVIDIGRGNNAQADHQAAADALALAGARELDGDDGARLAARTAMEALTNDVSFLGLTGSDMKIDLVYDKDKPGPFTVIFLSAMPGDPDVPGNDDTPITQDFVDEYVAKTDAEAKYVYVYSQARDLSTFFFNPVTGSNEDVPVAAMAVATLKSVTCDLTPLFMCNPVPKSEGSFVQAFRKGYLHSKLLKLRDIPNGNNDDALDDQDATAGNIGFLRTGGNGAQHLAAALAGRAYDQCIEMDDTVETQPGAVTSAWDGFNTRFDVFQKSTGGTKEGVDWYDFSAQGPYLPAPNVRKGWAFPGYVPTAADAGGTKGGDKAPGDKGGGKPVAGDECSRVPPSAIKPALTTDQLSTYYDQFPKMSDDDPDGFEGKFIQSGKWNLADAVEVNGVTYPSYWKAMYEEDLTTEKMVEKFGTANPSRYQVYKYEIENQLTASQLYMEKRSRGENTEYTDADGEMGAIQCHPRLKSDGSPNADLIERRTMLVAVVDCETYAVNGQKEVPFEALAKVFLVNSGDTAAGEGTLDIEVVGVSDNLDSEMDNYLKTEVVLVR